MNDEIGLFKINLEIPKKDFNHQMLQVTVKINKQDP